ncbi:RNA polymerase II largest subunit [Tanacetum coccineum]
MNKEAKKKKREEQIEKKRKLEPKKKEKQDKDSNQKKSDENEKVNMEESAGEKSEVEKHEDDIGNRKLQDLDKRTDIEPFITEWEAQYNHLGKPTPWGIALQMLGKVHPSNDGSQPRCELYLDELTLGATGIITVMIYHSWDVHTLTGRYVSTDFVMSDVKGNAIYSNAKANVAHNFLKLKEGLVYCLKNFVVQSNKEEYRIFKNHTYMIELDGATSVRKASVKSGGFVRYPFQLVLLGSIELTDNKYLIDVAGYVTNVGRINHQKSGSRTLDFSLANGSEDEVSLSQAAVYADYSQAKEETLENLLIWARNRKNDVSFSLLAIKLPYICTHANSLSQTNILPVFDLC